MKMVLGTMTFANQVDIACAQQILLEFSASGHTELDTAHQYCQGKTEKMLGELISPEKRSHLFLASKVHPWNDQGLQPDQVEYQLNLSLERLGTGYLDLLYLHSPDLDTPVTNTLERCNQLYQSGKIRRFGLSNYAAWQVAEIVEVCRHNGWVEPEVYQGMYNALTRDVETELFPCLRNYGIPFYAYNPLAGGLLSGKYRNLDELPLSGRFAEETAYQTRYWKQEYFTVLEELQQTSAEYAVNPVNIAMSWLNHHSGLDASKGDAVILGVSKIEHLQQNLAGFQQAPLPGEILDILDHGWQRIKPDCFRYFRP